MPRFADGRRAAGAGTVIRQGGDQDDQKIGCSVPADGKRDRIVNVFVQQDGRLSADATRLRRGILSSGWCSDAEAPDRRFGCRRGATARRPDAARSVRCPPVDRSRSTPWHHAAAPPGVAVTRPRPRWTDRCRSLRAGCPRSPRTTGRRAEGEAVAGG